MSSLKTPQDKAIRLAGHAIRRLDISDIWHMVSEDMEHEDLQKIYHAIDPDCEKALEVRQKLYEVIKADLKTEAGLEAFRQLDDATSDEIFFREIAWFYLGFLAAQKMGGWGRGACLTALQGGEQDNEQVG